MIANDPRSLVRVCAGFLTLVVSGEDIVWSSSEAYAREDQISAALSRGSVRVGERATVCYWISERRRFEQLLGTRRIAG